MSSTHSRRIKFVSISVPILYGNHAIKLTPENGNQQHHQNIHMNGRFSNQYWEILI